MTACSPPSCPSPPSLSSLLWLAPFTSGSTPVPYPSSDLVAIHHMLLSNIWPSCVGHQVLSWPHLMALFPSWPLLTAPDLATLLCGLYDRTFSYFTLTFLATVLGFLHRFLLLWPSVRRGASSWVLSEASWTAAFECLPRLHTYYV